MAACAVIALVALAFGGTLGLSVVGPMGPSLAYAQESESAETPGAQRTERLASPADSEVDTSESTAEQGLLQESDLFPGGIDAFVDENEEVVSVPEVVVTGSRMEENAASAAVRTEVISRAEIEASGARDMAELLEERAGLQVQRSFRGTELWLRGMSPAYTLVLVNGDRIPGRIGGAVDLSRYGVENIERVEIVRGPSSALYGSDAIGGVVNIITRDSQRDFEADAMAAYGLNNVIDATGRVAGRPDSHLRLQLNGGFHYSDPFRRGEVDSDAEANDQPTVGSSRLQWSLNGTVDWRPNSQHRFRVQGDYLQLTMEGIDAGAGGAIFDRTQLQEQIRTSIEHSVAGPDGLRLVNRVSYSQFREQYLLDQRGATNLDRYEDNREHMGQLTTLVRFVAQGLGTHTFTVGFEELFQVLESDRLSQLGERQRFAFFAQDDWIPWEDGEASLTLVPGVRYDLDSQFGDQMSPKLNVRLDVTRDLIFRATYGMGFRAPSFQQLLLRFENPSVGYVVTGNPNLGAERSHGADVSAEWQPLDEVKFELGLFWNDVSNLIATVTVDDPLAVGTVFSYENISSAWTMGVESSATIRIDDILGLILGYTLTETWDAENQRHLEGRARHRFTTAMRLAYEPWEISLVTRASVLVDRVFYVDIDADGVDDPLWPDPIAQIDLRLAKRFTNHFELFVGVDNLLDAGDAYTVLRPLTVYGGARGRY